MFGGGLALVLALAQPAATGPPAPAALLWATDAEGGAPYIFKDPQHLERNIGFEVELADALARELGRPITMRQYDYKSLLPGLDRGDFHFAMNGLEVTDDRRARYRFSRPYYVNQQQLVVRKGETRFDSLAGCRARGCLVGTLEDTGAERMLDGLGIAKRIYDSQVEPYGDLARGRIDAVLMDLPIALYYARPNPALAFAGPPVGKVYYGIAFRKTDEELARSVDAALGRVIASGELRRIYERWQLWNADQEELREAPQDVAGASRRLWTFARYFPVLAEGAWITVEIAIASMLGAILLGMPIALARLYGPRPLRWLATAYVEFFRGIPVLLLLYFLYYGLPGLAEAYHLPASLKLAPLSAAILGFALNYAAFEAEIYRAGIGAVSEGQWEAAASLGMSRGLTFRRIILPQAVRTILPPMTNDFVALFKDTSIVSVIAVVELSKQYQILSKSSMKYLEIGLATAALYLLTSIPLGWLSQRLEQRWSRG
jgi:polar amino acid transport system substrate-binding protein